MLKPVILHKSGLRCGFSSVSEQFWSWDLTRSDICDQFDCFNWSLVHTEIELHICVQVNHIVKLQIHSCLQEIICSYTSF